MRHKPRSSKPHPAAARAPADPIELTVEKLVPGGDSLARHEGKVVFLPGALPGEKVRARLTESRKDYARGEVLALLEPSPHRIVPPCPVFGRCGGCDWQHLDYPEQLRQKVALAADALRRVGGLEFPALDIEGGKPWSYRSRARLHLAPGNSSGKSWGYLARASHEVVPIAACPVADPALDRLIAQGPASSASPQFLAWGYQDTSALSPVAPGADDALAADTRELTATILGKPIRFDLRCFFQSNVPMLEKLIPFALEGLSGTTALDLYCGIGLFGAFLADQYPSILAVEENPHALAYARLNIPGPRHTFLEGRLEDLALQGRLSTDSPPDLVLVDPPRPGLDQNVRDWLLEQRPPKLLYVSCNPVTLARDLKTLTAAYHLDALRLFDFYPQTAHIEAVAKLSLRSPSRAGSGSSS